MAYDYRKAVYEDVKYFVLNKIDKDDFFSREQLEDYLNDYLWTDDSVTGNGSGSYTFNAWEAEENLCHNLELLKEALDCFGSDIDYLESPESCDVTIRCYLLPEAIDEVLDEVWR